MLIIKMASGQLLLRLSVLTPTEPDIENRLEGKQLKAGPSQLGQKDALLSYPPPPPASLLVGKRDTNSFQHVGTKVLAPTISHAGTSPGSRAAQVQGPSSLSVLGRSWDTADT